MRRRIGFTLIEMLLVVTIVGLVSAIALPRMSMIRQRMQLDTAVQQLVGDLRRAKIEALKRNTKVSLWRSGGTTYTLEYVGARSLQGGVTFDGPDSVTFASFGPTLTGPALFTLALGGHTRTVGVSAAGLPSVP